MFAVVLEEAQQHLLHLQNPPLSTKGVCNRQSKASFMEAHLMRFSSNINFELIRHFELLPEVLQYI